MIPGRPIPAQNRFSAAFTAIWLAINELRQARPQVISIVDDQDPPVERVREGRQDDGTFGVRVWDASGTLIFDQTA